MHDYLIRKLHIHEEIKQVPPQEKEIGVFMRRSFEPNYRELFLMGGGGHGMYPGEICSISRLSPLRVVWVPAGEFLMGSPQEDDVYPNELPQHEVVISRGFWIGQTPVTQAQFKETMGYNPSYFTGYPTNPVENVTWHEAVSFCHYLSKQLGLSSSFYPLGFEEEVVCQLKPEYRGNNGKDYYGARGFRLPTEAEWEYACRAGCKEHLYGNLDDIAWYGAKDGEGNSEVDYRPCAEINCRYWGTHHVGEKKGNFWNLYDVLGNIREWCWDSWPRKYTKEVSVDPIFYDGQVDSPRVTRGGCWFDSSNNIRLGERNHSTPTSRDIYNGFRFVITC